MHFYFDVRDDFYAFRDTDGLEFPDVETAKNEAIAVATSIAQDVFNAGGSEVSVTVRDEIRSVLEVTLILKLNDLS